MAVSRQCHVLLVILFGLLLAGCGGGEKSGTPASSEPAATGSQQPDTAGVSESGTAEPQAVGDSVRDAIGQLASNDPAVRMEAISHLAARGAQAAEAVAPLTALLKDASAETRAQAAFALGAIGEPAKTAAAALTDLLADEDAMVRRQAVKALGAIRPGPKVMIPLLTSLLQDADPGVRLRVLDALAETGEAAVPGLIEALKNDQAAYWACMILREMGPAAKDAVPALTEKLQDARPDVRIQAVLALGAIGEAAAGTAPQIAAALEDEHVRNAATFALGQLGIIPEGAEATIRANAAGDDPFLSNVSYWALARVHPEDKELRQEVAKRLVAGLKNKDPFVRVMSARAMAALPPDPEITIPVWEEAMKDADPTTVRNALDALAALGKPAVPRLIAILEKHEGLRAEAAYALGQIGPDAAEATDALAKRLDDDNLVDATEAALALGKIGPAAAGAVPALCAALEKEDEKNAHAIVLALGNIGPAAASAEPLVLKAMQGDDKALAVIAAGTFVRIQPSLTPEIAAKVVPVLVSALADPLPETRKAAADNLAQLGTLARDAADALEKTATSDAVDGVRAAAAKALKAVR